MRVGLTGGIGSGKSTVAALFKQHGVPVVDSDEISHALTAAGGDAIAAIRAAFGAEFIDASGALNRPAMRQKVFVEPAAKQRLEAILHPLIRARTLALSAAADSAPYVLLVVPLLFERKNYRELVQRTLVVDCAETTQISRTMQRSGLSEAEVRAIMAQQISRAERLSLANDVILNEVGVEGLYGQVQTLHQNYLLLSRGND